MLWGLRHDLIQPRLDYIAEARLELLILLHHRYWDNGWHVPLSLVPFSKIVSVQYTIVNDRDNILQQIFRTKAPWHHL